MAGADDARDPVSWLLIERGWKVAAADGSEVGTVDEVIGDSGKDIFNGISVSTGFLGRPKYVPSERVAGLTDGRIELDLSPDEVDALGEHEPQPPSEQFRP